MSDNKTIKISSQIMNTVDELILAKGSEVALNLIDPCTDTSDAESKLTEGYEELARLLTEYTLALQEDIASVVKAVAQMEDMDLQVSKLFASFGLADVLQWSMEKGAMAEKSITGFVDGLKEDADRIFGYSVEELTRIKDDVTLGLEAQVTAGLCLLTTKYEEGVKAFKEFDIKQYVPEIMPSKEVHYSRNDNMPIESLPQNPEEAEKLGWDGNVQSDCHQFTAPNKDNRKWVSPDGRYEVIFDIDDNIVTAPEDYGTYNFSSPSDDKLGHFKDDVLPWIIYGNSEDDSTTAVERLKAFAIDGSISALKGASNSEN